MITQKILLSILGLAVVLGLGFAVIKSNNQVPEVANPGVSSSELCFYKESTTSRGFKDIASVKMNIDGKNVAGEVKYLPAEKDSKVGTFAGTTIGANNTTVENTADVVWNSKAEGMQEREQLLIVFDSKQAEIGFGEMVLLPDGSYAYKDQSKLSYVLVPSVDCTTFISPQLPTPPTPTPPTNTSTQFDKNITFKLNDKIVFPDGLNVTLKQIGDSRCKPGVQCIWAGEISGNFAVSGGKLTASNDVRLGTVNNKSVILDGYTFTLKDAAVNSLILSVSYKYPVVGFPDCFVGGCSGQICSDQKNIVSTCEYTASYACYKTAECKRQVSGQCGWTQTPALLACLSNP